MLVAFCNIAEITLHFITRIRPSTDHSGKILSDVDPLQDSRKIRAEKWFPTSSSGSVYSVEMAYISDFSTEFY
jgi:hypothetical protein